MLRLKDEPRSQEYENAFPQLLVDAIRSFSSGDLAANANYLEKGIVR